MRQVALCLLIALCGCSQSEHHRFLACDRAFEEGEAFDFANTDSWRIGGLPFWTTPARIREAYGTPSDSTHLQGSVWGYTFDSEGPTLYSVVGDTLAYPAQFHLRTEALSTPHGELRRGAPTREVRALFPRSYRCRDFPSSAAWSGGLYDSQWLVGDSVRQANVMLYFHGGRLLGVGVSGYELGREAQLEP